MELSTAEWLSRLAVAAVLSGLVGFEREAHHKAAGLRTHILVGMGAAIFTLAGTEALGATDTSRMAAGVVTGVGFLGAGAIFRDGISVRGLTTAAGLWVVAAIGTISGAGELGPAAGATLLTLGTLYGLGAVDAAVRKRSIGETEPLRIVVAKPKNLGPVLSLISEVDDRVGECEVAMNEDGTVQVTASLRRHVATTAVALLHGLDGVLAVEREYGQ